uniref:Secreted peptide n=1 Tax=Heterorhabditis bacteriophora TaxID=37862 RepID=A0A1I7WTW7_HETBA
MRYFALFILVLYLVEAKKKNHVKVTVADDVPIQKRVSTKAAPPKVILFNIEYKSCTNSYVGKCISRDDNQLLSVIGVGGLITIVAITLMIKAYRIKQENKAKTS